MSLNHTRLQALLKKELSLILQSEAKNSKIGFVTITDLYLTKDLSYATVYFSIIGPKERVSVSMEGLEKSKGFLKSELSKRIKNIRKMPDLIFKYDESLEYGNNIQRILNTINKNTTTEEE